MFLGKIPALMGWVFTIVYIILWLLALYFSFFTLTKAFKTNHWLETTAKVFENKLIAAKRQNRTHKQIVVYSAKVRYEYQVDNATHVGITQKVAKRADNGEKIHKALLDQYPIGSDLTVYYDPKNPDQSVLQKGVTGLHLFLGALLIIAIGWLTVIILEASAKSL